MEWIRANTPSSAEGYELRDGDKKLAAISFSTRTHIARVISKIGKRLFFFKKKGLFTQRAVITNEYGVTMGMVEEERNRPGTGTLELDGKEYGYALNPHTPGELEVYDKEKQYILLTCSFKAIENSFLRSRSLLDTKFPSLLLVLCWYAFQPASSMHRELVNMN